MYIRTGSWRHSPNDQHPQPVRHTPPDPPRKRGGTLASRSSRGRIVHNIGTAQFDWSVVGWQARERGWRLLKPLSRRMRQAPTPSERCLWARLRAGQLGVKFRRQHVIGRFIVDFYCSERRLVVEVDGESHDARTQRDQERDEALRAMGLRVLRLGNAQVETSLDQAVACIRAAL